MNLTKYICSLCGRPIDGEPYIYYIDGVRKFRCPSACDATWRSYEEPRHISDHIFNALLKLYNPMQQAGLVKKEEDGCTEQKNMHNSGEMPT